ncbi:hypothetical protein BLNAU_25252 [Blattamonas nauphoetae]|uniref:Uncharacterized protein n=1 Tax=Blattamonas nauphoetae TaxID=2049346 RepID=A0ABQ9WKI1_9EUKA|nr:hypothetical protein BLNAU_25252 [Blattamonas nauphoetae]
MTETNTVQADHPTWEQMLPGLRQLADMKVELVKLLTALRDNDEEQLLIYERMRVPGNTQRTIAPLSTLLD